MQIILYENDLGLTAFWKLNPEDLRSPWLRAFKRGKAHRAPFELYPDICLTTAENHG
jgi:hypothetical protein